MGLACAVSRLGYEASRRCVRHALVVWLRLATSGIEQLLTIQVDPKFLRNQRYAKHGSEKALREARAASS
ncbi:hypothetical protein MOBT1_000554 [Malassezia obtusa]|uniref:Uncharacterized protein n=1 Tax=Malassezia obtusa TaxID=76774 RepID=A0AAF0DZH9_9BASI|nr:hypothetical protein MOBT1_000554 [Malassezia obtusa]